ncbi:MAG: phytoene/squalene synthase family protein [Candidatus Caenarcaniphilales bacterium]|nr:phytoene/squalene synthase family protein [Candidatus Caenarcaniphilales bacterium]
MNSKSFTFATNLLPAKEKKAIRILYGFCRTYDNLVDESPNTSIEEIQMLQKDFNSKEPKDEINKLFKEIIHEFNIPMNYANDLIEGCIRDLSQKEYETFSDLCSYCYQVASTVGLMSCYILGFNQNKREETLDNAIKAGIALQLTNIIRDVGEDLHRGRIYLPKEDFQIGKCNFNNPESWKNSEDFKRLISLQITRARSLYKESKKGLKNLSLVGRLSVSSALRVYEEILSEVEKNNYDVLSKRAFVPMSKKIQLLPISLLDCLI